jgi:cytoskeletal protein CcmA (bactofilin family)
MHRYLTAAVIVIIALAALAPPPAAALEVRGGPLSRVDAAEVVDDDLYIASGRVNVDGRVNGDLITAGGNVRVRGQVDGDALIAGGTVDVTGRVGESVRAIGGTVTVDGTVGGDVIAIGGSLEIDQNAKITRDVAVIGGEVTLRGSIGRNLIVAAGHVVIAGNIGGNVLVRGGEVIVDAGAVIRGNLTYSSEQPVKISPDARISGRVIQEQYPVRPMPSARATRAFRLAFGFVDFFWMLVMALVTVALVPHGLSVTADALSARPWGALGWGFALLIGVPILLVVLVVSLVGIPVASLLFFAHVLALLASHAAAALAIGRVALTRASAYGQVAVGVVIIAVATHLPVIGFFLRLLVVAVGVGAVAIAFWSRRRAVAA